VAQFITQEVLPPRAYIHQCDYLRHRTKPRKLSPIQWHSRISTLQLYLPFMVGTLDELKEQVNPQADWKGWWKEGGFRNVEIINILENHCPPHWILKRDDIHFTYYTANDLTQWYQTQFENERQMQDMQQSKARHDRDREATNDRRSLFRHNNRSNRYKYYETSRVTYNNQASQDRPSKYDNDEDRSRGPT
jgi:hypothetical protein